MEEQASKQALAVSIFKLNAAHAGQQNKAIAANAGKPMRALVQGRVRLQG